MRERRVRDGWQRIAEKSLSGMATISRRPSARLNVTDRMRRRSCSRLVSGCEIYPDSS
jgi:hypothetical protein